MSTPISLVEALPRQMNGSIDLRRATFQDDVDAVLTVGPVLTSFKRIGLAIRDPRCKRPHLCVLYRIMEHIHYGTGTAFESRKTIAEGEELSEKTVENVLYDLRRWGHVEWERRPAPGIHPGRLLHYVLPVCRFTEEDIALVIGKMRDPGKGKVPVLTGTKSTRPNGEFPTESTRPDGDSDYPSQRGLLLESPRPNGEFMPKSPRPDGVSIISLSLKKERKRKRAKNFSLSEADVMQALESYNASARQHGFTECRTLTEEVCSRLIERLEEIGLDTFLRALSVVHLDSFLMGLKPPKDGSAPFKLTIQRLLQTEGKMGDVLANLSDQALEKSSSAPLGDFDAEVKRFAETELGRKMRQTFRDHDKGMELIRSHVKTRRDARTNGAKPNGAHHG